MAISRKEILLGLKSERMLGLKLQATPFYHVMLTLRPTWQKAEERDGERPTPNYIFWALNPILSLLCKPTIFLFCLSELGDIFSLATKKPYWKQPAKREQWVKDGKKLTFIKQLFCPHHVNWGIADFCCFSVLSSMRECILTQSSA